MQHTSSADHPKLACASTQAMRTDQTIGLQIFDFLLALPATFMGWAIIRCAYDVGIYLWRRANASTLQSVHMSMYMSIHIPAYLYAYLYTSLHACLHTHPCICQHTCTTGTTKKDGRGRNSQLGPERLGGRGSKGLRKFWLSSGQVHGAR